ncbi:MAG: Gfo/Idh/MocA family oxidoreductase [Clostridia bacterium]|nr:Gfo/Idh/MocA family oxidoreductase [Clostridia bacterium]
MYKIAIIGSENSHAMGFASVLAPKSGERKFPDIELIGVCGDEKSNAAIAEKTAVTCFTDDPNAFLGKVDGIMVTSRHGGVHLKYAKPYMDAGCKIWLDKPITASVEDAGEVVRIVKEKNLLLCGGSSLAGAEGTVNMAKFVRDNAAKVSGGHVTAPVNLVNDYGNFWFYSQHLVQMITEVFGQHITSVEAREKKDGVHAILHYPDYDVTAYFGAGYSITAYLGGYGVKCQEVNLAGDYYMAELLEMADMLRNNHVRQTPEEVVYPVYVIDALIRSMESGGAETTPAL